MLVAANVLVERARTLPSSCAPADLPPLAPTLNTASVMMAEGSYTGSTSVQARSAPQSRGPNVALRTQ